MNPCPACAKAELCPTTGLIHAGCRGCEARALAKSPAFAEAAEADAMTQAYKSALQAIAGERWQEFHKEVKGWVKLTSETKCKKETS